MDVCIYVYTCVFTDLKRKRDILLREFGLKKGSLRSYRGAWERFQKFICGWGTSTYEKMAGAQEEERVGGDLARVASFLGHSEGSRSTVVYVKPR